MPSHFRENEGMRLKAIGDHCYSNFTDRKKIQLERNCMTQNINSDPSKAWKEWLAEHSESLAGTGIPKEIYLSEVRWIRLLEEGTINEKEFSVTQLEMKEARKLHEFILIQYGNIEYRGLLRELEIKFGF